jgi:chemotaxis protein methyltransferase CheR
VVLNEGMSTISELQAKVLHDPRAFDRLMAGISVNVTSMFRDPAVYVAFRRTVVPMLRTYPFVRIWHAGCSTGEEVYSLAIVLLEENLYDRCRFYATDINEHCVAHARRGVFSLRAMQRYARNYHLAGGTADFSEYYVADSERAVMRPSLRRNLVFSQHSLVSDGSFNEFNVIFCRNVLIYFDNTLRDRVHALLFQSLCQFGLLVLGGRELIDFTPHARHYERIDERNRIYRKRG